MNTKSLDEDLAVLAESIAKVLAGECEQRAVHAFFDRENELDETLWNCAAEQGWLGIGLPETYGGLELGARGLDVLYRALGRALAPGFFIPTLATAQWLSEVGPAEIKDKLLPAVVAGYCTFATPLAHGDTVLSLADGLALAEGRISGESALMLGGRGASIAVVPVTDRDESFFALIELDGTRATYAAADIWDRTRSVGRCRFNAAEPLVLIADPTGSVAAALRRCLALAVAGDSVGSARVITEQTVDYLKERKQFGRALASFQALKHRVADLMTAVVHAEAMLDQAVDTAAADDPAATMWADLAQASAAEKYKFIAEDCVQLFGGVGFTWEFDCHIFLKRALLNREIAGNAGALRDLAANYFTEVARTGGTTAELTL